MPDDKATELRAKIEALLKEYPGYTLNVVHTIEVIPTSVPAVPVAEPVAAHGSGLGEDMQGAG